MASQRQESVPAKSILSPLLEKLADQLIRQRTVRVPERKGLQRDRLARYDQRRSAKLFFKSTVPGHNFRIGRNRSDTRKQRGGTDSQAEKSTPQRQKSFHALNFLKK